MERYLVLLRDLQRPFERDRVPPIIGKLPVARGQELLLVPFDGVVSLHQHVVVLHELAEREQNLTQIDDLHDLRFDRIGLGHGVGLDQVSVLEQQYRSLDRIARGYRARLTRPFDLDLGADGQEIVDRTHGRRADREGRQSGGPASPVSQTEPPGPGGVAQNRASRQHVLEVLEVRLDLVVSLVPGTFLHLVVLRDEVPTVHLQVLDVLLQLRGLQAQAFRDYQCHAPPDRVGADARQVAETRYLGVLGLLPIHADRAVLVDQLDLLVRRQILEMLLHLVERDLLLQPFHLLESGHVLSDAEFTPDDIGDQDAHGLASTAGGPDRSIEENRNILRAITIGADLDRPYPNDRCHQDPLGQHRKTDTHRPIKRLLSGLGREFSHFLGHQQGDLLPAFMGEAQLTYPLRHPLHMPIGELLLDPGRQVLCLGDLHERFRIEALLARQLRYLIATVVLAVHVLEVPLHAVAAGEFLQSRIP